MSTTVDFEQVSARVKERIRQSGLDPLRQRTETRLLVDDVLAGDFAGDAAARAGLGRRILDDVAGFGPLQEFFDDPTVEEIWINNPGRVFVARAGRSELTAVILTEPAVRQLLERMLHSSGRRLDLSTPFVDAVLPDGSRLHAVIPDVTRANASINIRKFIAPAASLDDLVALGSISAPIARFLTAAVESGLNIIVSGATASGKTTLLNCLLNAVPASERIITCEEVFELRLSAPDWVALQTRQASLEGTGEIALRRLVKEALRMRPSRLVIGEVRQEEALDLLIALNSGQPGMCSLHANSAREAVAKLCTLPLLSGPNVTDRFVVPAVASAIDLVVHTAVDARGRRSIREVLAIPGRVESGVVETATLWAEVDGELTRGAGFPPHPDRFARAGHDLAALMDGRSSWG